MKPILWIIAAPSCVGKTTFIKENKRLAEITGLESALVVEASNYLHKLPIQENTYMHCCLSMRSLLQFRKNIPLETSAIILVAALDAMKERALKRIQDHKEGKNVARAFPRQHITPELWVTLYERGIKQLEDQSIPMLFVNTNNPDYPLMPRERLVHELQ